MPSSRFGARARSLAARYDAAALRPFQAPVACGGADAASWPALHRWCLGEGPVFAVAQPAEGPMADNVRRAMALALELDGTHELRACHGAMARMALRARVKWDDALGRGRVWDCGWVPGETAAWAALARWTPRRPTFIVMKDLAMADAQRLLATLQSRSPGFVHPVRVLVLAGVPQPANATWAVAHIPA